MKKKEKRDNVWKDGPGCELVCKEDLFCWIPRIIAIIFIFFVSLFALDVFGEEVGYTETILGLIIHLVPSLVLIALLVISWKHEKIGGILFVILGVVFTIFFNTYHDIVTFLMISVPVFLVGILFWVSATKKHAK